MRILTISNLYPRPGADSLAPFNRQQVRALSGRHEILVIAPVPWTKNVREWIAGNPTPRHHTNADGIDVSHPIFYYIPKLFRSQSGWFFRASIARETFLQIGRHRPEVILSCWAHPDGWAATSLARRVGLPSVVKVVGSDILIAARSGARRRVVAEGLIGADAVVAVSCDLARHVVAMGVSPERVHVVPEGLDSKRFSPGDQVEARRRLNLDPNGPLVLFVGNLLMSKGVGVLIEAMARLSQRDAFTSCLLVGQGPDEKRIRGLIERLGLGRRVILAGSRPHDELPEWYRASDVVALPSFSEGIPNVLREAAACGRPYVATRVGGIPEIAGGHASLLVEPGNPSALADALAEVLTWGPQPPSPGISWETSAGLLADVLKSVVRDSAEPAKAP